MGGIEYMDHLRKLLSLIDVQGEWGIQRLQGNFDSCFLVNYSECLPDTHTGKEEMQEGRQFYVDSESTTDEIYKTLFHAYMQFKIHEAREGFKIEGKIVEDPHREYF